MEAALERMDAIRALVQKRRGGDVAFEVRDREFGPGLRNLTVTATIDRRPWGFTQDYRGGTDAAARVELELLARLEEMLRTYL